MGKTIFLNQENHSGSANDENKWNCRKEIPFRVSHIPGYGKANNPYGEHNPKRNKQLTRYLSGTAIQEEKQQGARNGKQKVVGKDAEETAYNKFIDVVQQRMS